jgi:hypothetical protein
MQMADSFDQLQAESPSRLSKLIAILGAASVLTAVFVSRELAVGVLLGSGVAWLSFFWLRSTLAGLVSKVVEDPSAQVSKPWLFLRFLLRYALLGGAAYAMMKSSQTVATGIILGLLLLVPALLLEGVYLIAQSRRFRV